MISEEETNKNPLRTVNDVIIVRKEASVDSGRIAVLYPGEAVLQVSENGKWSEIRFAAADGLEDGYVKTEYLADAKKRYLAKEKVNVRKESDPDSEKLGAYLEKDPVLVEEQLSNGWSKVRYLEQEKAEVVDGYVCALSIWKRLRIAEMICLLQKRQRLRERPKTPTTNRDRSGNDAGN